MRKMLTLLLTLSGLSVATLGHAANGQVDLTWGVTCTPIVQDITPVAGGSVSLMASVIGNDQTHSGYQVVFLMGSAARLVPDAWRFDAAAGACQGPSFITINHLPPGTAVKTCPAFAGPTSVLQIKEYRLIEKASIYDQTLMTGLLANAYPAGNTTLASQRYFLAQWLFDHTFSVVGATTPGTDCGGLETPMCVALLQGERNNEIEGSSSKYVLFGAGTEIPFDASPNNWLTTHGLAGCPTVPAQNTTWGQIKSQYRQ